MVAGKSHWDLFAPLPFLKCSLPVRGLTELTREGEVPVWGVKWPVVSVRPSVRPSLRPSVRPKSFPNLFPPRTCHVHAFRDDEWNCIELSSATGVAAPNTHLGMIGRYKLHHETGFCARV